jgi:catechol 2,3-dioxygenase-like lactoylglutathione lyase family enzyme
MTVPARISLVTLGVADVARATAFYQALGWPLSSASVEGEVSFFRTAGGLLGLFGAADLATDAGLPATPAGGFRGVALAINVASPQEVDAALAAAVAAGGTVPQPARTTEWGGYSGYFADPDGHAWEVAHNPFWPLGPDGLPVLP